MLKHTCQSIAYDSPTCSLLSLTNHCFLNSVWVCVLVHVCLFM